MSDATEQRRRPIPLLWPSVGVIVLAVVAAVVIVLVRRHPEPKDPEAAAVQWADAVLGHHTADAARLQCRPEIHTELDSVALTASRVDGVTAVSATRQAGGWQVAMQTEPASSGARFGLTVIRRDGRYLVCD